MHPSEFRQVARHRGAVILLCLGFGAVVACDSVLGIEEPRSRPIDGAAGAGLPPNSAGDASFAVSGAGAGGDGGAVTVATDGGESGHGGGAGGQPPPTECTPDEARCSGEAEATPQICDDTGHWVPHPEEAEGDCPVSCRAGKCVECKDDETRCTPCEQADSTCESRQVQKCVRGEWLGDGAACEHYCDAGQCRTPTSCAGAQSRGVCTDSGESCCRSIWVPGGTFKRDYDPELFPENDFGAEISPFVLDKYEVTVGRMKQFVAAYENLALRDGDGKSKHVVGDTGWNSAYVLPASAGALTTELDCQGATWSDEENNIRRPVNCVSFNVAYAFCIWDGGRLPTEAEWNFAAAGGNQQRAYPWGTLQSTPEYGYFFAADHLLPTSVGLTPKGNGRWGHADLAGNVSEWTLDYYYEDYPTEFCKDCLAAAPAAMRAFRGGPYTSTADNQFVAYRGAGNLPQKDIGFRCVRDPR